MGRCCRWHGRRCRRCGKRRRGAHRRARTRRCRAGCRRACTRRSSSVLRCSWGLSSRGSCFHLGVLDCGAFLGARRADLSALLDEDDALIGTRIVDEGAEALAHSRVGDRRLPFALVGVDHVLHLALELVADAQRVVDQYGLQVVEATLQVVAPGTGALQAVGRAHVEHQEAVDQAHQGGLVEVGGDQLGMARLHAAVAAHVEVPAALGGDDAHVLALGLGAFARAARDAELDLVRRAQPLVAVLQFDRQPHGVIHAVAAPGAADAAFHRPQRLAVGMAGLEAGGDQFFPDRWQLLDAGAEQVHPLATGDLGVQAVLLRHLADCDQPLWRDLATGHARHHRIGTVLLDVAEEVVVAVLQAGKLALEHEVVPARGEDRRRRRFADVAAQALAVAREQVLETPDFADADQVVELLARVGEVLAQVVVHRQAEAGHLGLHDLGDQRHAAATGGAGLGAGLDLADGGCAFADRRADLALAHVVAGADLRAVGQGVGAETGFGLAVAGGQDQKLGVGRQRDAVQCHLQQGAVLVGVADQHCAEQVLAVGADDDLLVDLLAFVGVTEAAAARRPAVGVADAGHIHAHQLELGAHVRTAEGGLGVTCQLAGGDARHLVARGHQAEGLVAPGRALADGEDRRIAGAAVVVDRDAATGADGQCVLARELVARTDAGGEHDHVGLQVGTVGKHHAVAGAAAVGDLDRVALGVHLHAQGLDLVAQDAAAFVVHLHRHQAGREFDDVGLEAEVAQRLGALQAEQAAAHHDALARDRASRLHRLEVLDGAIDEALVALAALDRWHEGIGPRGQHQLVVGQGDAVLRRHRACAAVDRRRAAAQPKREACLGEEAGGDQREVFRRLAGEEFGEVHTVVGDPRLLAQYGDFRTGDLQLPEFLEELVADHAMANENDLHAGITHSAPRWAWRYLGTG
ncbi:cellobiohydrolase A [Thauera sp. 27]|nr:cellobiohydrolase A [Thauera sp. 27]